MNFLQVVQHAQGELGLPVTSTVISSVDPMVQQFKWLLIGAGQELASRFDWQVLTREHTITTVAGVDSYALPADFASFRNETAWDRTNDRALRYVQARGWAYLKGRGIETTFRYRYRVRGNRILLDPVPTAEDTLTFEYSANWWLQDKDILGDRKAEPDRDDDEVLLDYLLLVRLLKLKWLEQKGFDTQSAMRDYMMRLDDVRSRDEPTETIRLDARSDNDFLIDQGNLADTGYGA